MPVKKIASLTKSNISVYEFETFDNFVELCNYINLNIDKNTYNKLKKSKLYKYNDKYYLVVNAININLEKFRKIHCFIIEFAKHITESELYERRLIEYGTTIFKTNAFEKCIKAFLIE